MKVILLAVVVACVAASSSLSEQLLHQAMNFALKQQQTDPVVVPGMGGIDYNTIRNFVGCETGISTFADTVFQMVDLVQSDGWTWQVLVFAALYIYAWYQQNGAALTHYCGSLGVVL